MNRFSIASRRDRSIEKGVRSMFSCLRFALALVLTATCWTAPASAQFFDFPGAESKSKETESTGPTVPVFTLKGTITEQPRSIDPIFGQTGGESLQSLITRLDAAAEDDDVKGVVLLLGDASFGYAQLEELRAAMERLKAAEKPVYAHADSLTTKNYALLCGASRLSVSPTGDVWVTGMYGEGMYLRGLLDLLKVQPDFLTSGDYKSAGEMFTRSEPSPEAREMEDWLYDSLYASLVQQIADGRGVSTEQVREWINTGLFSAESACETGLIDVVEHRQDFANFIEREFGEDAQLDKSYGKSKSAALDLSDPFAAMNLLMGSQSKKKTSSGKDVIAIVHVEGAIQLGEAQPSMLGIVEGAFSEPIRRTLDQVAEDDDVKAVVLRVNSPGGSAVASEVILNATKRVASRKPIVVSMGDVAGSGGYYVACGSERIYADRATITGSIGVVAGKVVTTDMWARIGINFHPIERGENADIFSSSAPFDEEQRQLLQDWMTEVYDVFKGHVVDIRGDRLTKPIDELAGGRVYTGEQALELGLVDEIGGLEEAITYVAEEAGLEEYEVRSVPEPENFLDQFLASLLGGEKKDDDRLSTPQLTGPGATPRLSSALLDKVLPVLAEADPRRVRLLQQAARQIDILHAERIMLTMPLYDLHD
ncbi:MAG: signal peptide peptidase SppA [Planctomycetota bacterium]|nr:MAG: signal peptide peptidase SppA [Planctomycetota bacterium]